MILAALAGVNSYKHACYKHDDSARAPPKTIHTVKEISVHYEGRTEEVAIRPPDVSTRGMFSYTPTRFPEGTVLNLRFRLAPTGAEAGSRAQN